MTLNIPVRENKKLETVVARINEHVTLNTYWYCSNINAIDRLGINDHGPVHIRIVANLALKILRMLIEAGVQPSVEKHHKAHERRRRSDRRFRGVLARYRAYRSPHQSRAILGCIGCRSVCPIF
jgi:hypothetical protein